MASEQMSIGDLAEVTGLSPRAIRYYVHRGLLQPPEGAGRGAHYRREHVDRILKVQQLQGQGYSLEGIKKILESPAGMPGPRDSPPAPSPQSTGISVRHWLRMHLGPGLELHVDLARHQPEAEQVLALKACIDRVFASSKDPRASGHGNGKDQNP